MEDKILEILMKIGSFKGWGKYGHSMQFNIKDAAKEIAALIEQPQQIELPSDKELAIELIARTAKTANSRANPTYKAAFIDCYNWIKQKMI